MSPARANLRLFTRTLWTMAAFLVGFTALLIVVSRQYLLPALAAFSNADPGGKRQLAAVSALMLAILLVILVIGLLLVFRVRRFFFPRPPTTTAQPTLYRDAWTEAGQRARPDPPTSG